MTIEEIDTTNPHLKKLVCLNQKQTSDILGVSSGSLENWRREGLGPRYIKIESGKRGRILYPKSGIVEWLNNMIKTV